jgi:hypothetical protein
MTTGGGVVLAALGAILLYAVDFTLAGININVIGVILIVAGLAIVVLGLINSSRRRTVATERPAGEVRRERVVERDPDVY